MEDWNKLASNILRAELKRRGITYDQLQKNLAAINVAESSSSIRTKISRGAFQFTFFLQCAKAIGLKNLNLSDLNNNELN